jgi:hypothetical protein
MAKASLESLNTLHDLVAQELARGLDDPKILSAAIKFLKDNDITADLMTDDNEGSLGSMIKEHLKMPSETRKLSVEDMLTMGA